MGLEKEAFYLAISQLLTFLALNLILARIDTKYAL